MFGCKRLQFFLSVIIFFLVYGFRAYGQGIPIRFDLDDSGISSNIFTNQRQPFPLDCLLTGDCGDKDADLNFPGMKHLLSQKDGVKTSEEFHLRFSNLSNTKTFLLHIPMEIKVSELTKYIFRVGHVEISNDEIHRLRQQLEGFDVGIQEMVKEWKKGEGEGKRALGALLDNAASMEQVKKALAMVPRQETSLHWMGGRAVAELREDIESFERSDYILRILLEKLKSPLKEVWDEYEAFQNSLQRILLNFDQVKNLQSTLENNLKETYPADYSIALNQFLIEEAFARRGKGGADVPGSPFSEAFFEDCPLSEDNDRTGKKDGTEHVCAFGRQFCEKMRDWFKRYGFPIGKDMIINFSRLSEPQKYRLLSLLGAENLMLFQEYHQGLLEFFTHFYLGEEKISLAGALPPQRLDLALENIVKRACASRKVTLSGNFVFLMASGDYFRVLKSQLRFFHAISMPRKEMLTIKVEVFNEGEVITNSMGYIVWKGGRTLKSGKSGALAGTIAYQQMPFLKDTPIFKPLHFEFLEAPLESPAQGQRSLVGKIEPYVSDQSEFFSGTGKLTLNGNLGTIANAKVILQYQSRNLGAADQSDKVEARLYRLAVFEKSGSSLAFGKFGFDNAADGLGINLDGEGLHWIHPLFDLGYLIRQESEAGTPNAANRDHKVYWGKIPNLGLPRWGIFHTVSFHALYGQNEKDIYKVKLTNEEDLQGRLFNYQPDTGEAIPLYYQVEEDSHPNAYWTLGLQGRFSVTHSKKWSSSGYLAYFQSERRARSTQTQAFVEHPGDMMSEDDGVTKIAIPRDPFVKGAGRSWLLSWTFQENQPISSGLPRNKVQHRYQFLLGQGSGGYREGIHEDRGYLGETSSFAPDLIFLSSLAPALTRIEPTIGKGLANKSYASLRYQRDGAPLIKGLMKFAGWDENLVKANTTFAIHYYRLNTIDQPRNRLLLDGETQTTPFVLKSKNLGWEFNLIAEAALPNKIKPRLMAAYYAPGSALDDVIKKDLWFAGLSLSLEF